MTAPETAWGTSKYHHFVSLNNLSLQQLSLHQQGRDSVNEKI